MQPLLNFTMTQDTTDVSPSTIVAVKAIRIASRKLNHVTKSVSDDQQKFSETPHLIQILNEYQVRSAQLQLMLVPAIKKLLLISTTPKMKLVRPSYTVDVKEMLIDSKLKNSVNVSVGNSRNKVSQIFEQITLLTSKKYYFCTIVIIIFYNTFQTFATYQLILDRAEEPLPNSSMIKQLVHVVNSFMVDVMETPIDLAPCLNVNQFVFIMKNQLLLEMKQLFLIWVRNLNHESIDQL